jgi:hypothetical protein
MKTTFGQFLGNLFGLGKAWWLEVSTSQPACTYYFGPFTSQAEAEALKAGYIEDLEQEGAQSIQSAIHHCNDPDQLTIEGKGSLSGLAAPVMAP